MAAGAGLAAPATLAQAPDYSEVEFPEVCNDPTRVVPGRGPLVGRADLPACLDMLLVIRQRVSDPIR